MTTTFRIPVAEPIAVGPMLASLRSHTVPGYEHHDSATGTHRRAIRTNGGAAHIAVRFDDPATPDDGKHGEVRHLEVHVEAAGRVDVEEIEERVRQWLDLGVDPSVVDAVFEADSVLGPLVQTHPGLRVVGTTDWFATAVSTVLGQQVSVAAACTFAGRLVAAFGDDAPGGLRCFPTAHRLATVEQSDLRAVIGTTQSRARTVAELARAAADGVAPEQPSFGADLLALPGIGPWTVDYLALRLGDRDAYPSGDLVLRRALQVESAREATERAEQWRPWRAYAVMHLWTHATYSPPASSA
ncbi:DNA-3-methyladenine glycosylase family protein [Rhodococcus rhodochrous]|uniref:DNA-3-methyladenine glycosylase family protein n=1 Tax=Rhodococcus rhodochrous TaxID=1829 RepID=UPI00188C6CF1|nr:DNA-3-methyladenine glycosylase 2 family protein [Rhodococcus rhodochrous]MBF4478337.1 DNA-3-methyladenine glycosylase 2 family protein [Rhodococcus rhodochrous]